MVYALTPNSMHMMREEWYPPQSRRTPSFSSTLLDTIYRSIDESKSNLDDDPQLGLFKETTTSHTTPKQSNFSHNPSLEKSGSGSGNNKERMNLRRAVMIEDWMENQTSQQSNTSHHLLMNSIPSTSSESSTSGALFSSSETDTTHKPKPKPKPRPKSVRNNNNSEQQKPKREGNGGGFARTKLRALKIYGDLNQKVKQPISPGSRIASFLSSIFNTAGSVKKAKMCYVGGVEDVSFDNHKSNKSPCFSSSASSFSRRSCMSKTTTTSSSSSSAKAKRTVRFYPVSIILGEDSHSQLPSGHVYTYENDPSLLPLPSVRKMTKGSSIKEVKKNCSVVAKENGFIKGYQSSCKSGSGNQFGFRGFYDNGDHEEEEEEDDDDDDDALSCSSSDLFELDHLIGGAGRYQEELPVYETTNLETNKAIANGLRL